MTDTTTVPVDPERVSPEALEAAVELEIEVCLGLVTTRAVARLVDRAVEARVAAAGLGDVERALAFFASCIKSGESWSDSCEAHAVTARVRLARLRGSGPSTGASR